MVLTQNYPNVGKYAIYGASGLAFVLLVFFFHTDLYHGKSPLTKHHLGEYVLFFKTFPSIEQTNLRYVGTVSCNFLNYCIFHTYLGPPRCAN